VFEEKDGEPVLVVRGGVDYLRFSPQLDGQPQDQCGSGHVRERVALTALIRNKWFTPTHEGGHMKIRLGERARKVREGKEDAKAAGPCSPRCAATSLSRAFVPAESELILSPVVERSVEPIRVA
jgi:hypothetical protein